MTKLPFRDVTDWEGTPCRSISKWSESDPKRSSLLIFGVQTATADMSITDFEMQFGLSPINLRQWQRTHDTHR
jgi:hypothetical protein